MAHYRTTIVNGEVYQWVVGKRLLSVKPGDKYRGEGVVVIRHGKKKYTIPKEEIGVRQPDRMEFNFSLGREERVEGDVVVTPAMIKSYIKKGLTK